MLTKGSCSILSRFIDPTAEISERAVSEMTIQTVTPKVIGHNPVSISTVV